MMLQHCTEACGWVAAFAAAICWGSFGVPVKGKTCEKVNVDPLVMQSYKTIMCFLTCWFVIPMGEPFKFTPWGILSGVFWVPGATAGIFAIRNAGLAISVGTWSSLVVVSSFCWGIFVFHEKVRDIPAAICATLLLCAGLGGMSRYSHPRKEVAKRVENSDEERMPLTAETEVEQDAGATPSTPTIAKRKKAGVVYDLQSQNAAATPKGKSQAPQVVPLEIEPLAEETQVIPGTDSKDQSSSTTTVLLNGRIMMTRRQLGLLGACINGTWGGTNLIPMHYAKQDGYGGAGYVISFACGAMLILLVVWLLRYLYHLYRLDGSHKEAFEALPSFHLREMWLPGLLSGTLYSVGNFSSIIATTYLGQGVGYSVCQSSMLVSGIWGIFYFGEIQQTEMIFKWFGAALVTIAGILWLSYEHLGEAAH